MPDQVIEEAEGPRVLEIHDVPSDVDDQEIREVLRPYGWQSFVSNDVSILRKSRVLLSDGEGAETIVLGGGIWLGS